MSSFHDAYFGHFIHASIDWAVRNTRINTTSLNTIDLQVGFVEFEFFAASQDVQLLLGTEAQSSRPSSSSMMEASILANSWSVLAVLSLVIITVINESFP